jgi:hypothetical protein
MMRLTSVDLPTLGRPMTARTGRGASPRGAVDSDIGSSFGQGAGQLQVPGVRGPLDVVPQVIGDPAPDLGHVGPGAGPRNGRDP